MELEFHTFGRMLVQVIIVDDIAPSFLICPKR